MASFARRLRVLAELKRRERAEAGRLLYVGLTRAQDRLVLSGGGSSLEAWRNRLEPALQATHVAPFVQRLTLAEIPDAAPRRPPAESKGDTAAARGQLARIRAPLQAAFEGVPLEAVVLEDFRRCPRRCRLLHALGLPVGSRDGREGAWAKELPVRHRAARGSILAGLAAALSPEAWAGGVSDAALGPHLAVQGLSLGEARALHLVAPLRALAATRAVQSAVAAGSLAPSGELVLEVGVALLLARATLSWTEAGTLQLLLLVTGTPPAAGLEAFQVTSSVLWHAAALDGSARRVGLCFVDGPDAEPRWLDAPPLSREELALAAAALLHESAVLPALRPVAACEALGCGFLPRCHPPDRRADAVA